MKPLHVWTSDHFNVCLPQSHAFPAAKYPRLRELLLADRVIAPELVHRSVPAPRAWLERVHTQAYVARVLAGALTPPELRRLGMPWSPALVARARAALFGTVMAACAALEHGIAANLAGGSHHAFHDRGEGFCLFNDLAVASTLLLEEGAIHRPFVLDLDVHQGNGTAAIFAANPDVFTFSIHGARNYPLHKERSTLDVELDDGCGDAAYLAAMDAHLPAALDRHRPDCVFYQAGVDGLQEDRFGRLALSLSGLRERDARVFAWCARRALPVVVTLGGGYARPLEASVAAHAQTLRAARRACDARHE